MILLRSRYYQRTLDLAFRLRNRDDVIFPNNRLGSNFDYESRVLLAPPIQNLGTYLNFSPLHCLFTIILLLVSDEE